MYANFSPQLFFENILQKASFAQITISNDRNT
jgi:hypothetical protein